MRRGIYCWGGEFPPRRLDVLSGRFTLDAQTGNAAAGKAAIKLVSDNAGMNNGGIGNVGSDGEAADADGIPGALAGLSPDERSDMMLSLILQELDDDKAEEIVTIDLEGKSDIADVMVIASGRSQRHVGAMADKILRRLKETGFGSARCEGQPACDWVLIDAGDVIVHLFRPEVRSFYNLERVWSEAAHAPHAASSKSAGDAESGVQADAQ